ncbi:MAG: 2OG-Fe(II) oxygenase [Pseudobdellovibrio sp.]
MKHFRVHKNFFAGAKTLRQEFNHHMEDPRSADSKRFVWDYWYYENQYHLIRTPAFYYFTKKIYEQFHSYLVQWGRENLGCHDISPPWLSYYVDGCYQNLHSDVPHGPWAFVYSLTLDPNAFKGGETLILKPDVLNYWSGFQDQHDREYKSFVDLIPSHFNQLVVFDPRFPHGVTELKGTRDPLKSRLVIHGWFVEPRPYVVGGLTTEQVQEPLAEAMYDFSKIVELGGPTHGTVSVRLEISSQGLVTNYKILSDTLLSLDHRLDEVMQTKKIMKKIFSDIKFPKRKQKSFLTIPILFK